MKGAWHYWMQQYSSDNTIEEKTVRSAYIPYGLKVYAHVNLSSFHVSNYYRQGGFFGGHADVVITAYGQYTARHSWHTVPIYPGSNYVFLENPAWVQATLYVSGCEAIGGLSILAY